MKDMICLDVAVGDFVQRKSKKLCNYKKMAQLSQILCQITKLVENKPSILPKQDLVHMLRVSNSSLDIYSWLQSILRTKFSAAQCFLH